jgi:hypothetical protein
MSNSAQNPDGDLMRPGRFEFMVMNTPFRRIIQEHIESEDIQPVPEKEKKPVG